MKIGFQGYFLNKPYTGIGQYSVNLLNAISKIDSKNEYFIAVSEKVDIKLPKNFHITVIPQKNIKHEGLKKIWWEQMQASDFFKNKGVEVVHFPYPSNPWYGFNLPSIVTVHDTIPWDRKAYAPTLLSRLKQSQTKKALKRATKIITVSNSTADDLFRHFKSLKLETETVYNAPSEVFVNGLEGASSAKILEQYQLTTDNYLLYVGGYDERKNVKTLADAYFKYVAPDFDIDLVFVGDKSHLTKLYKSLDYLTNFADSTSVNSLKGSIKLTGFVSEDELCALYSGAFVFLNTSLQEGFNIPLIEAAVRHVPIVTSDIPVHREILGNHALFCDPLDRDEIGGAIRKLCEDSEYYKKTKTKADAYKCPYSWELSAKKIIKIYEHFSDINNSG